MEKDKSRYESKRLVEELSVEEALSMIVSGVSRCNMRNLQIKNLFNFVGAREGDGFNIFDQDDLDRGDGSKDLKDIRSYGYLYQPKEFFQAFPEMKAERGEIDRQFDLYPANSYRLDGLEALAALYTNKQGNPVFVLYGFLGYDELHRANGGGLYLEFEKDNLAPSLLVNLLLKHHEPGKTSALLLDLVVKVFGDKAGAIFMNNPKVGPFKEPVKIEVIKDIRSETGPLLSRLRS